MSLATISPSAVELARTPEQTLKLEAVSSAAMAYAREINDYEAYMNMWRVYILARRKTTALIQAELQGGNMHVTDSDYGFTKMQWSRRLKELSIPAEAVNAYFDELVSLGWQPSINGLLRTVNGGQIDHEGNAIAEIKRGTRTLRKRGWMVADIYAIVDEAEL